MTTFSVTEGQGTVAEELKKNPNIQIGDFIEYLSYNQQGYEKYKVILHKGKKTLDLVKNYDDMFFPDDHIDYSIEFDSVSSSDSDSGSSKKRKGDSDNGSSKKKRKGDSGSSSSKKKRKIRKGGKSLKRKSHKRKSHKRKSHKY